MRTNRTTDLKCRVCGKPGTAGEWGYDDRAHTRPKTICRRCAADQVAKYRTPKPPKPKPTEKVCVDCGVSKPVVEFDKRRRCGPCDYARRKALQPGGAAERSRSYWQRHKARINAKRRTKYALDAAYRKERDLTVYAWRRRHRGRYLMLKLSETARRRRQRAARVLPGASGCG
jgi:hypothetical protein